MENDVTTFLKALRHPLKSEIEEVRKIILSVDKQLEENIKWNGPNFKIRGEDRITMRIQPPPHLQLIFHRGAKASSTDKQPIINDTSGLMEWKTGDRAVITLKSMQEVDANRKQLKEIIKKWLAV